MQGAKKAAKMNDRICELRKFVNNKLSVLISDIEGDSKYVIFKEQMSSSLQNMLEEFQQNNGQPLPIPLVADQGSSKINHSPLVTGNGEANSPSKTPQRKRGKRCSEDC